MYLPFRIDYINTIKNKEDIQDKDVYSIATEEALASHERISLVVDYIIRTLWSKNKKKFILWFKRKKS